MEPPTTPPTGRRASVRQRAVTPVAERSQTLHRFTGELAAAVDEALGGGVDGLGAGCLNAVEVADAVLEVDRVLAQLSGLRSVLLARGEAIDFSAHLPGPAAVDSAGWVAHAGLVHGRVARRRVRSSTALVDHHPATASALLAGHLDADQAESIAVAVDRLPARVGSEQRARAEQHLLIEALRLDAVQLRVVGRRLLEVVDPEAAEEEAARRLQREEDEADRRTALSLWDDRAGTTHLFATLPTRHAAMLRKALHALANPQLPDAIARTVHPSGLDDETTDETTVRRPTSGVLGEAFVRLLERLDLDRLPLSGGLNAAVVVTMGLDTLRGGLGVGTLDTGEEVSPGEARRMACSAGVLPAVLSGTSEVLDLGRSRRLFTTAQRRALALRQHHTCGAEGCDRPAAWADAHHLVPWSRGGATDLDDGVLLCARHHTLAHHPRYDVRRLPDHRVSITRRPRDTPLRT